MTVFTFTLLAIVIAISLAPPFIMNIRYPIRCDREGQ